MKKYSKRINNLFEQILSQAEREIQEQGKISMANLEGLTILVRLTNEMNSK